MASEPQVVTIDNKQLRCAFCQREQFRHRKASLHGRALALFDLEWLGKSADCYVCANCGHVHLFYPVRRS